MYTIGKIKLTQQALAVFVIGTVSAFLSAYVLRRELGLKGALTGFIFGLAVVSYTTYLTNCTVVGDCKELAWFLVALNVFTTLLFIKFKVLGSRA